MKRVNKKTSQMKIYGKKKEREREKKKHYQEALGLDTALVCSCMCECAFLYLDAPDSIVSYQSYLDIKVSHINMNAGTDDDNNSSKKTNEEVRGFFF